MTEKDLLSMIENGTNVPAKDGHPTYYDAGGPVHPTEPVDYDEERLTAAEEILGESDFSYHPALGTPHVDIYRYPKNANRPFACYLTSGMSDFITRLKDGSSQRVELLACTATPDNEPDINSPSSITQVIRYVSLYPFIQQRGISYYHVIELPIQYQSRWGKRILLIPPFLLKDLAYLPLMGQNVSVLGMIRITDNDFDRLLAEGPDGLFDSWNESFETWLFDTENRLTSNEGHSLPPSLPKPISFLGRLFGKK